MIFANTLFKAICYRPDECQIITAGTDRKVDINQEFRNVLCLSFVHVKREACEIQKKRGGCQLKRAGDQLEKQDLLRDF